MQRNPAQLRLLSTSSRLLASGPTLPPCDYKPPRYPGKPYDTVLQKRKQFVNPVVRMPASKPLLINQGFKQWIFDHEGRRYLDMYAGVVTVGVGHSHPKLVQRMSEQISRYWHTTTYYLYSELAEYAEKLASKMPGDLKVCYFVNSGSEANDLALTMARLYSGCNSVITLKNSYHGILSSHAGITACSTVHYNLPEPSGIRNTICPDVYRGPWGGKNCRDSPVQADRDCDCKPGECKASDNYLQQLEDDLKFSMPNKRVGAFLHETIQGFGGTVQYPKDYLKKAYKMIRANGGVCIADEVQTGFGRTGTHYWGFQGAELQPDIVTMAKSIANGFPFAAVITTPKIAETMLPAIHFSTYGSNPLGLVAASTVLDIIDEEKLMENSHKVGTYILKELSKLRDEFSIVGDVRGKGLMIGVEMVESKTKKTPLAGDRALWLLDRTQELGLIIGRGGLYGNTFRIKPPMCVTKQDADFTIAVLRQALGELEAKMKKQ